MSKKSIENIIRKAIHEAENSFDKDYDKQIDRIVLDKAKQIEELVPDEDEIWCTVKVSMEEATKIRDLILRKLRGDG